MWNAGKVKQLCNELMLQPEKARGQHFLIDDSFTKKMVEAARVGNGDMVVEVGPGLGILTESILQSGSALEAFEIEQKMIDFIKEQISNPLFHITHSDILRAWNKMPEGPYSVIANVPYQITGAIIRGFLEKTPRSPKQMVIMIQKEVADRIMAVPGDMSMLSFSVQWYGQPKKLFKVPKGAFWPQPKVDSAVLHIQNINRPSPELTCKVFALVNRAFKSKRKMISTTLAGTMLGDTKEAVATMLEQCKISPNARPQELSVKQWKDLIEKCPKV